MDNTNPPLFGMQADDALIDSLYDSLRSKSGFEAFLQLMKERFNSSSIVLLVVQNNSGHLEWSWMSGVTARFDLWCKENDQAIVNELLLRMEPQTNCLTSKGFIGAGLMLEADLVDIVADDLKPWLMKENIVDTAGLLIPVGENSQVLLALQRDGASGKFSTADLESMNRLTSHIKRVANLLFQLYYKVEAGLVTQPSADEIRKRFPLTPTEALVCELLVQKMSPKEIARKRAVSVHTVREQMRKIYQKTGCKRQVDVVTLILQAFAIEASKVWI